MLRIFPRCCVRHCAKSTPDGPRKGKGSVDPRKEDNVITHNSEGLLKNSNVHCAIPVSPAPFVEAHHHVKPRSLRKI